MGEVPEIVSCCEWGERSSDGIGIGVGVGIVNQLVLLWAGLLLQLQSGEFSQKGNAVCGDFDEILLNFVPIFISR